MKQERKLLSVCDLKTYFSLEEGVVKAVDGVSFTVEVGKTLGIVGESGCGKSVTSLSILNIVDPPGKIVEGDVWLHQLDGNSVNLSKAGKNSKMIRSIRGNDIGFVFQEPMTSFSPVHTIGSQIIETISLHKGVNSKVARELAIQALADTGIPDPERRIDNYSFELSGGLRQRAMIATALACNPRLLIADEPTTALDVTTQAQILDLLRHLQSEREMAILLITHDLGVIAEMADSVIVMYLGQIVEEGPVKKLFHEAKHPYTKALLSSIPKIDSTPKEHLPVIQGAIPHPYNRPAGCTFHPRCEFFMEGLCDKEEPQLIHVNEDQKVRCLLYNTVVGKKGEIND